jgi:hypothetical protein
MLCPSRGSGVEDRSQQEHEALRSIACPEYKHSHINFRTKKNTRRIQALAAADQGYAVIAVISDSVVRRDGRECHLLDASRGRGRDDRNVAVMPAPARTLLGARVENHS